MPYGTTSKAFKDGYSVQCAIRGSGWASTWTSGRQCAKEYVSRHGTNATPAALRAASDGNPVKIPVRKLVKLFDGPRVAIQVGTSRTGKPIFKRDYRWVYKTFWKNGKGKFKLSLAPNSLSTTSVKIKPYGDTDVSASHPSGLSWSFSGAIWNIFAFSPDGYPNANAGDPAWYGVPDSSPTLEAELTTEALGKFYQKLKSQEVNMGQVVAERNQTAKLIADSVSRLLRFLLAAKSGQLLKATKILFPTNSKEVASDWLAYQYGVRPLVSDIEGLVNSVKSEKTETFSVSGVARKKIHDNIVTTATQKYGCCVTTTVVENLELIVRYKGTFAITHPGLRSLAENGITNPASLAWEVMPWSFLIDWLVPVGDYLNKLDASAGTRLLHCHRSVLYKRTVKVIRHYGGKDLDDRTWSSAEAGYECESVRFGRTVLTDLPEVPLPTFKNPFSAIHVANFAALMRQLKR